MRDDHPGRVEDYTIPFLVMAYLVLVMVLVGVWGIWGYAIALMLSAALHAGLARWHLAVAARDD